MGNRENGGMEIRMKTTKELEDAVRQYQNGDTVSFDRIYELSYRYLYTCVIHVVKDEEIAADMLQETYLEISRNISQLKSAEDFLSWASTIGNRKCYAYLKKQRDVLVRSDNDQDGDAQDFFESIADDEAFIPEAILQDREKQRLVQKIIDGLSDMQRLCIIGFYYRGQSGQVPSKPGKGKDQGCRDRAGSGKGDKALQSSAVYAVVFVNGSGGMRGRTDAGSIKKRIGRIRCKESGCKKFGHKEVIAVGRAL